MKLGSIFVVDFARLRIAKVTQFYIIFRRLSVIMSWWRLWTTMWSRIGHLFNFYIIFYICLLRFGINKSFIDFFPNFLETIGIKVESDQCSILILNDVFHEFLQFRNKLEEWNKIMGKLSKVLLNSLFFISAEAQSERFAVTGCNTDVSNQMDSRKFQNFLFFCLNCQFSKKNSYEFTLNSYEFTLRIPLYTNFLIFHLDRNVKIREFTRVTIFVILLQKMRISAWKWKF